MPVYFDYNATTPLDPVVRQAMVQSLDEAWGNPSSVHAVGRAARAVLDEARYRFAGWWKCKPSEVVFTGGGTEANNLAVLGTARRMRSSGQHLICSPVEHPAVLHAFDYLERFEGFQVTRLPVDAQGRVAVESVAAALRPDTTMVSVMAANNEVGTLQPVAEIGALCRERGVLFHTDAVQVFGKEPILDVHRFNADLVTVCAHKFHGPKGAGVLYIRSPLLPVALQIGGAQENERRGGTENISAIVGLATAYERNVLTPTFPDAGLRAMTNRLAEVIAGIPGVTLRGHAIQRLANTLAFTVSGADSIGLLANLDMEGVCASSGSACSAGSLEPSHVLRAMGVPLAEANSLVRFSLGRENTMSEVEQVCDLLPSLIQRVRR
ncbi:MAG TPA: cysteine desulfurase family protein [Candidatus Limnocylindria bacterium]|nr:cysteine desulfurase family protein [Candidatus Limnocylindria bacterium]